jgi:hypothetical protein
MGWSAIVAIALLAALCAAPAAAQSSSTAAPKIQPDAFATPSAKAAPIKPAKSCSQYGEDFVYVPSADTCVKAGGYVRSETGVSR